MTKPSGPVLRAGNRVEILLSLFTQPFLKEKQHSTPVLPCECTKRLLAAEPAARPIQGSNCRQVMDWRAGHISNDRPGSNGGTSVTAIVLCILWLLWPVIAFTGGLSYPIFAGLAALVLLPSALHSLRPRIYMAALLVFFIFAGVSATWSPQEVRLVDFDFVHMKFAVRSEMIRVGLLVVAIGCLIAAASTLDLRGRIWVTRAARASLIIQLILVTTLSLYEKQALDLPPASCRSRGRASRTSRATPSSWWLQPRCLRLTSPMAA